MSRHKLHGFALQALLASAVLAGCGGGGDAPAFTVTADNAVVLAAEALDATVRTEPAWVVARLALQVELDPAAPTGMVQVGAVPAPGFACPGGGLVTMDWNTLHDFEITVVDATVPSGDTLALTASDCWSAIPEADTFSGRLDAEVVQGTWQAMVAYDLHPRYVRLAIRSGGFTATSGPETVNSVGDLTLDASEVYGSQARIELSGSALANEIVNAGGTRKVTLRDYARQVMIGGGSTAYGITATVDASNPRLASGPVSLAVRTGETLLADAGGEFTAGSLHAAAEHSSLTLTVTGRDQFRLEIDSNGDGAADESMSLTLAQLKAQL